MENEFKIMPLGAGNEVGRSCVYVEFKGKRILLDCGIHPAYNGLAGLPYLDMIDPVDIDIVFITHFHLDHVGALPYFLEKTNFKGKVYMTHPTKAIYKWLLLDYVKVSHVAPEEDLLYSEKDLLSSYDKIQAVDYHQEIEYKGVKFTCFNAGHVLGAAMFLIEIAGVKMLYTGDYSREEDRHLLPAEIPYQLQPDILICEATYGVQSHEPREERERRFVKMVHEIVGRGGKCLLPVFALGKAQELLLILDEYWEAHPELQDIPIYYASSLAKKCLAIYQTYLNMMNPKLREYGKKRNPFIFRYVSNVKDKGDLLEELEGGPCVMMASPGMLQNGLSRRLFEAWCSDKRNGVVLPGYSVEGTLAKSILTEPSDITPLTGGPRLPLKMSVDSVSFSAHVDFVQNAQFIDILKPKNLILVHGESNEMNRLKLALQHKYSYDDDDVDIGTPSKVQMQLFTPRNCEPVTIQFAETRTIKVVGKLAADIENHLSITNAPEMLVDAVLVGKNFEYQLMKENDLANYTPLKTGSLRQRINMQTSCPWYLIVHLLMKNYKVLGPSKDRIIDPLQSPTTLFLMDNIQLRYNQELGRVTLEWDTSPSSDLFADSIVALILSASSAPNSVKMTKQSSCHSHGKASAKLHKSSHEDEKMDMTNGPDKIHEPENFSELFEELLLDSFYDKVVRLSSNPDIFQITHHGNIYSINMDTMDVKGHDIKTVAHLKELLTLFSVSTSQDILLPVV